MKSTLDSPLTSDIQFMQRSLEKEVQEQLEKERKRVISEAEWVLDTKDTEIQKP